MLVLLGFRGVIQCLRRSSLATCLDRLNRLRRLDTTSTMTAQTNAHEMKAKIRINI
jgi:hypothetical protein